MLLHSERKHFRLHIPLLCMMAPDWFLQCTQRQGLPLKLRKASHGCLLPVLPVKTQTREKNSYSLVHAFLQKRAPAWGHQALLWLCPSHPPFLPLILDMNSEPFVESKQPALQCVQELVIKSQTVLSHIAPVGLGRRKERARLDRCCFLAARLRG